MRFCRSLITGATALLLSVPAYATTIPSVASGEAADRESALTSALRHAIEQVVGMSVNTSTYVSNLKSIQDKIYTGATGYIESYEVVDEQRTPAGYRVTVSAKVAKEKLSSAVAPIVGNGAIKLDGKLVLNNVAIGTEKKQEAERALKALLDELSGSALKFTFSTPTPEIGFSEPDTVRLRLNNFRVEIDEEWYGRLRSFCNHISSSEIASEVYFHAESYANTPEQGSDRSFVADLINDQGEVIASLPLRGDNPFAFLPHRGDLLKGNLPYLPPQLERDSSMVIIVPKPLLKHVVQIRVRNPQFTYWPVPL